MFVLGMAIILGFFLMPTVSHAQASLGPYKLTCTNSSTDKNGALFANCANYFGTIFVAMLPKAADCGKESIGGGEKGDIWNVDGTLRCTFSSQVSQSHRDIFNILSISSDTKDSSGETKVWRIDHPDVIAPLSTYPQITIKPGDRIRIAAAGCVQIGGMGNTWKLYTDPSGDNSDRLYSGLLNIPGVTPTANGQPERIGLIMAQQPAHGWQVPASLGPDAAKSLILQLGYQDDGYSDNGYYSHDNGDNDQCLNIGPAWVEISVITPADKNAKDTSQMSPYRKGTNFDLSWKLDGGEDDNGLPLNPVWSYQIAHPDGLPDFQPSCVVFVGQIGIFFPALGTCTSQDVTQDVDSGLSDKIAEAFGDYCSPGPPHGHVNWSIATYSGIVHWRAWSGDGFEDDDDNLGLVTADNAGQTLLSEGDSGHKQPGIGVEFKQGETLDTFADPFWKKFLGADDATKERLIGGKPAMITALVGIDGVHGGYAELHPAFSVAIRTDKTSGTGKSDETWTFFIRNQGNEGSCASYAHDWPSSNGIYIIQLPRPDDATGAAPTITSGKWWAESSNGFAYRGMEYDDKWSYLKFQMPPGSQSGIDGELTLRYAVKSGAPRKSAKIVAVAVAPKATISSPNREEAIFGMDWEKFGSRITDPGERTRFLSDVHDAFTANATKHAPHTVMLTVSQSVAIHKPHDGAASHGRLTRDIEKPDREKDKQVAAIRVVLRKYAKDLNLPDNVLQGKR